MHLAVFANHFTFPSNEHGRVVEPPVLLGVDRTDNVALVLLGEVGKGLAHRADRHLGNLLERRPTTADVRERKDLGKANDIRLEGDNTFHPAQDHSHHLFETVRLQPLLVDARHPNLSR